MEQISSRHNPRFKAACKLLRGRGRQKQGRILVIGNREVGRAAKSGLQFEEVFLSSRIAQIESKASNDSKLEDFQKLTLPEILSNLGLSPTSILPQMASTENVLDASNLEKAALTPPRIAMLDDNLFSELAYGDRQVDLIGIASRPATRLTNIPAHNPSLVVVLESLEKPGNLGAITRSADGCGATAILLADPLTDIFHPNSIRSSVATVFSLPIGVGSSVEIHDWLVEHDHQVLIATPVAEQSLYEIEMSTRSAIVLGNEASGVSPFWRNLLQQNQQKDRASQFVNSFRLPMRGIGDSLNVSATSSIIMYEWLRRYGSVKPL